MTDLTTNMTAAQVVDTINGNLQEIGSEVVILNSNSAAAVCSALNGVFAGISGVTELDENEMNAGEFIEAINTNFGLAADEDDIDVSEADVETRYKAELKDTAKTIKKLSGATFVFTAITDIHYNSGAVNPTVLLQSARNMKALSLLDGISINANVCVGDVIEGYEDKNDGLAYAKTCMDALDDVGLPMLLALGNHDDNCDGLSMPQLTLSQMKTAFIDNYINADAVATGDDYFTYYKDFTTQKIRIIVLYGMDVDNANNRTFYYGFTDGTKQFLANSLLGMPNDYKAIVVTHVPPCAAMRYSSGREGTSGESGTTTITVGGESVSITGGIAGILTYFAGRVIALICGHTHLDNVWSSPVATITMSSNKSYTGSPGSTAPKDAVFPIRTADSYTDDLWDTVLVRPSAGRIDFVRFGAGYNRYVHYSPIECAVGASVSLTPSIDGALTWMKRNANTETSSSVVISNGTFTVPSGTAVGTLIQLWCYNESCKEYWTIKVTS